MSSLDASALVACGAAAAAAPMPPPMAPLHRHALESVLAFCDLKELTFASAVAREWRAAVGSMAPLGCSYYFRRAAQLPLLCGAPLRRHVAHLDCSDYTIRLHAEELALITQQMPHLRQLEGVVRLAADAESLPFPPRLVTLEMGIDEEECAASKPFGPQFAAVLASTRALGQLELLMLHVSEKRWGADCLLAPLARLPHLRRLSLLLNNHDTLSLSNEQLADLRALVHLEYVELDMDDELLARLLAPPHSLRWQELWGFGDVTEVYVPLLLSLPLRKFSARLAMEHAYFFTKLPHLTELRVESAGTVPLDIARVLQAVGSCSQLRTLSLCGGTKATDLRFSSADLHVCLSRLPHLSDL